MSFELHTYPEHHGCHKGDRFEGRWPEICSRTVYFPGRSDKDPPCFRLTVDTWGRGQLETNYFIGADWLEVGNHALFVLPKLDSSQKHRTDFLRMLEIALETEEGLMDSEKLYFIDSDEPEIELAKKDDLLTPLLVVRYVNLLRSIVKKGLIKGYKPVKRRLSSKVKGKVLVSQTIKEKLGSGSTVGTHCQFEEYGTDIPSNRLLKKALGVAMHYLDEKGNSADLSRLRLKVSVIREAFAQVGDQFDVAKDQTMQFNPFFREYEEASKLAKAILKGRGHQILDRGERQTVFVPPFWIDMSRLFELYVFSLLQKRSDFSTRYHFKSHKKELDYLMKGERLRMVADAKYKSKYERSKDLADMRQLSGYSRLIDVYKELDVSHDQVIDCLVLYPDQNDGHADLSNVDLKKEAISEYVGFYKVAVRLPTTQ